MKEKLLLLALLVAALTATPVFAQVQGGGHSPLLFSKAATLSTVTST